MVSRAQSVSRYLILALSLLCSAGLGAWLAHAKGETKLATAQTERAILELDGWLRVASHSKEVQYTDALKDLIDVHLDSALAIIMMNADRADLGEEERRQLAARLRSLHAQWSVSPPFRAPHWQSLTTSMEWKRGFQARLDFMNERAAPAAAPAKR